MTKQLVVLLLMVIGVFTQHMLPVPLTIKNCLVLSNQTNTYCYLENTEDPSDSLCMEKSELNMLVEHNTLIPESIEIGQYSYNVQCDYSQRVKASRILIDYVSCAIGKPAVAADCAQTSNATNSCCFYSYGPNTTGCYWIGDKVSGTVNWTGLIMTCSSFYWQFQISSLIYIALLFLS